MRPRTLLTTILITGALHSVIITESTYNIDEADDPFTDKYRIDGEAGALSP